MNAATGRMSNGVDTIRFRAVLLNGSDRDYCSRNSAVTSFTAPQVNSLIKTVSRIRADAFLINSGSSVLEELDFTNSL